MSSTAPSSKAGATFLWVLGAFLSFAVLYFVIQSLFAHPGDEDPRASVRLENKEEILKAQDELIAKMGLSDPAKKASIFTKTIESLKAKPAAASSQVVPGSPTQLKQAAAPAPEAAPAAPVTPPPAN